MPVRSPTSENFMPTAPTPPNRKKKAGTNPYPRNLHAAPPPPPHPPPPPASGACPRAPATPEGKARSAQNATRRGLRGTAEPDIAARIRLLAERIEAHLRE